MPNEAHDFSKVTLEARHVPEPDETYDPAAHDDPNHVTGFVDIGAVVDGVFVPLVRRKAPGLLADIARAKSDANARRRAREERQEPSPVPTAGTEPPYAPPGE